MTTRQPPPQIGEQFGRWTVTGPPTYSYTGNQARRAVPCECRCGTARIVLVQTLRRGDRENMSCGCYKREQAATLVSRTRWRASHGLAKRDTNGQQSELYQLWKRINRRCYDPTCDQYRWYGGADPPVTVWEGWRRDAGAFIEYVERELGPRPSPQHSIDRFPPDAPYAPGKIRWADPVTQARNRRARSRPSSSGGC